MDVVDARRQERILQRSGSSLRSPDNNSILQAADIGAECARTLYVERDVRARRFTRAFEGRIGVPEGRR
jgi:hypothetical protein